MQNFHAGQQGRDLETKHRDRIFAGCVKDFISFSLLKVPRSTSSTRHRAFDSSAITPPTEIGFFLGGLEARSRAKNCRRQQCCLSTGCSSRKGERGLNAKRSCPIPHQISLGMLDASCLDQTPFSAVSSKRNHGAELSCRAAEARSS